jgi:hypothetical protein|tara:strand:+ start:752 stop:1129 length:378 start_codon:yes stop_codon:yes gene_type:complete
MKLNKIILIGLLIIAFSCNNDDDNLHINLNGTYIGTFERNGVISNVELDLAENIFTGSSEITKYPAICSGNYSNTSNEITFSNLCVWTAEFDWTLILNGRWTFNLNGENMTLVKSNGDKYTLTKQ